MTAGKGVVHAEMPVSEEPVVGLQLWVNLSRRDKAIEPMYQELKGSQIPKRHQEGVAVSVISGEALGVKVILHLLDGFMSKEMSASDDKNVALVVIVLCVRKRVSRTVNLCGCQGSLVVRTANKKQTLCVCLCKGYSRSGDKAS